MTDEYYYDVHNPMFLRRQAALKHAAFLFLAIGQYQKVSSPFLTLTLRFENLLAAVTQYQETPKSTHHRAQFNVAVKVNLLPAKESVRSAKKLLPVNLHA